MFKHIAKKFMVTLALFAATNLWANPGINTQTVAGPDGGVPTGNSNLTQMSKNGRYMLYMSTFSKTPYSSRLYVTDVKTGETQLVNDESNYMGPNKFGISENGRFIAYADRSFDSTGAVDYLLVKDRMTGTVHELGYEPSDGFLYVTNTGDLIYMSLLSPKRLKKINRETGNVSLIDEALIMTLHGINDDGSKISYATTQSYGENAEHWLYDIGTNTKLALSSVWQTVYTSNVSGNGKVIVATTEPNQLSAYNTLTGAKHGINLSSLHIEYIGPYLSVSYDGLFATFKGAYLPTHPEYAAIQEHYYDRIFRVNIQTGEVVTISQTWNGAELDYFVNATTRISNDGRFVSYPAYSKKILPVTPQSTEQIYHVTATDFDSEYLIVGLPNSDQNWTHFSSMSLIGDHTWEGTLYFDGEGVDAFKFDMGGQFVGGNGSDFLPTPHWAINYGDNNSDGVADANGNNILVTEGAGFYRVSFNSQSKIYSVAKLPDAPTVEMTFRCENGTTYLGQSVYAVGSISELGNWNTTLAVKLNPTSYPTWTRKILMPSDTAIEWKCVKRDETNPAYSLQWQSGPNNTFNTATPGTVTGWF